MIFEFVQHEIYLFIALAVVIVMLVYSYVGDKLAGYTAVNSDEAVRLYNQDAFLLDVRSASEYQSGFIGEAENISSTDIRQNLTQIASHKNDPVLVYCQSGGRSSSVARLLVKEGFTQVHNLSGGIMTWKSAGLPINTTRSIKKQKSAQKSAQKKQN